MRRLLCFVLLCFCVWADGAYATTTATAFVNGSQAVIYDVAGNVVSGFAGGSSSLVSYGAPQIEMGGLITAKGGSLGASTSLIQKTEQAISKVIAADVAAAPGCAGGGLVGFLGCEALVAVTTTAISLGMGSAFEWLFNQVTGSGSANVTQSMNYACGQPSGTGALSVNPCGSGMSAYPSSDAACQSDVSAMNSAGGYVTYVYDHWDSSSWQCYAHETDSRYGDMGVTVVGTARPYQQTQSVTVGGAVSQVQSSNPGELAKPMIPATTAALLDAAWQQASQQSGYDGIPYPSTNPISGADVSAWESANPGWVANEGDWLGNGSQDGSQSGSGSGISSLPLSGQTSDGGTAGQNGTSSTPGSTVGSGTGSSTGTGTPTGASSATGASSSSGTSTPDPSLLCTVFPSISACASLGSASASSLPASSVDVSMSPWNIGPSSGTCPAPVTFQVFSQTLAFDFSPLCRFVTACAPLIEALCAFAAAFIVIMGLK
ncbi:TPA: hypothetical protein QDB01_000421 [Burkholderia vietnamiensis]|nr:hypothetical protein [Burkholderia vietnamiensis]